MSRPIRILQVHNEYYTGLGGEDTVAALEADMLRRHGHEVERLIVSTTELRGAGMLRSVGAALGAVWSIRGYTALRRAVAAFSPDIIHAHNTFPLLSPSIFWAAHKARVPVVQTLHNFRMTCANGLLFRDGEPCQQCVGRFPWPALRYRCYRASRAQTAVVACMNVLHRCLGTFTNRIDAYVALADFSKEILVRSGLPRERVFVKPNFVTTQPAVLQDRKPQTAFVGRIAREKGIHLLVQAWSLARTAGRIPSQNRLVVIGDGPDRAGLEQQFRPDSSIDWYGTQTHERVMAVVAASRMLALPSLCYENCPVAVLEAFSVGTPVIAPDHGPFPAMVSHQNDGLLFSWGDVSSLADALSAGSNASADLWSRWSSGARSKYLARYTERLNYERMIAVYQEAIRHFEVVHPRLLLDEA